MAESQCNSYPPGAMIVVGCTFDEKTSKCNYEFAMHNPAVCASRLTFCAYCASADMSAVRVQVADPRE